MDAQERRNGGGAAGGGWRGTIRWELWMPLLIIALTVLAYINSFGNPFLFDDESIIVNNPDIRQLWPLRLSARWVVNLSFKLNYLIGQLRVADYHATNLAIHVWAALVLYGLIRRTLALPTMHGRWMRHAPVLAGTIAVLWAVHPLQTQSVTYICQRYESMMGLLYLGTLYLFVRGVQSAHRSRAAVWFGFAVAVCLLGMGTKEIMVTAPLMVLLYDGLLVGPSGRDVWAKRKWVHLGLWSTLGVFAWTEWQMFQVVEQEVGGVTLAVSPLRYLMTQMQVIPHYLRLSIVPMPLCLDYEWPFVTGWREVVVPGALLVALGLGTLWLWFRRRTLAFPGLWFFVILAPTSSVVPVPDAAFEHRMYLPLAAVLSVVVLGSYRLAMRAGHVRQSLRVLGVVAAVVMVAGVVMTHCRNRVYRSPLALWSDVVRTRPDNRRARLNLSSALLRSGALADAGRHARIVADQLAACQDLNASDIPAWGSSEDEVQRYRDARHYAIAHNLMGVVRIKEGALEAAEAHFAEAVRLLPQFKDAASNLKRVRADQKKSPAETGLSTTIDSN